MRFGMLICQDITFVDVMAEYEALGIRDVIFSTHFANLRPVFKMGLHFQGFSMDRGINLIGEHLDALTCLLPATEPCTQRACRGLTAIPLCVSAQWPTGCLLARTEAVCSARGKSSIIFTI